MKQNKIGYLFGAGEVYGLTLPLVDADYVIAVDGGYTFTKEHGIDVHVVVGDFDSLGTPPVSEQVYVLPVQKDDTDMLAAIKLALQEECTELHIFGGTGGRVDHTLANIQCLAYLGKQGKKAYLYDEQYTITMVYNDIFLLPTKKRGNVSVFCYGEQAQGVFLEGLLYTLENATLTNTFPIGVSNAFVGEKACVKVEDGMLLVCWER